MLHGGKSLGHRIMRASVAVGIAHLLFKLAGLVQAWAMARYLPAADYATSYVVAFEGVIFSLFLVGEESLAPAFLPTFMREVDTVGEKSAWRFANTLFTLQTVALIAAVAVLMLFPAWITRVWTQWSATRQPESYAMSAASVRRMAPALLGFSLGSTTYVMLNAHKRFFLAAFGDAIWKFVVAGGLVVGVGLLGFGVEILIWGIVAGSVLKLLTHMIGLRDKLVLMRPRYDLANPALKRMLWLALPLLIGIVFAKIRDNVNNVYLLSALDSAGLMQANSLGRKLQSAVHFLVPYSLSIAVFPFFCELVDRNDRARVGAFITRSGRYLLTLFLPFAFIVAALSFPLTDLVFAGGRFDALAVRRTSVSMACYTFVLPAAAIEALVMQAFFAHRRMIAVTVAGIVFSALSMAISWAGLRMWAGRDFLVLITIAGGVALTRALKSWALVVLLGRHAPLFPLLPTLAFLLRIALVSVAAGAAAWLAARYGALALPATVGNRVSDLVQLAFGGGAALATGAAACAVLRVREPFELLQLVLRARARRHVTG
jgi:putative peptidoglycan lipid II flippase